MSDSEDVSLPVPTRRRPSLVRQGSISGMSIFSGLKASGRQTSRRKVETAANALVSTFGAGAGAADGVIGGNRRLLPSSRQSSWKTSNGTHGGDTKGSFSLGGLGGGKACMACGMQFTWRQRRHHCRACRKVRHFRYMNCCCSVSGNGGGGGSGVWAPLHVEKQDDTS